MTAHHLGILDDPAQELKISLNYQQNARRLVTGYEDLVVVLIEPTDKVKEVFYEEILATSETLLRVSETIQFASGGQGNMEKHHRLRCKGIPKQCYSNRQEFVSSFERHDIANAQGKRLF